MYSPVVVSCIQYMTRKNVKAKSRTIKAGSQVKALENRLNNLVINTKKPRQRKKTPFADAGSIMGRSIGGMFGNSGIGTGVGRWLGSGIGSIFGSGDYQMNGAIPKYNVITNGSQIPQFNSTRQTNIVCHREYLGDISGTAGFNNTLYPLNPGISTTFPWLSSVAQNYQEYRFHGLVFEFRSLITDFVTSGAPGVVVMSTNYNADVPAYTTKQQMENAEYAVSVKPTVNMMHGIECALGQTILPTKFIRSGNVPIGQDLRLYDQGNFQFATQTNPVQNLGELWVSYCVEFFKPVLPLDVGGSILSGHVFRSGVTSLLPLGATQVFASGSLPITVVGTSLTWLAQPGQQYEILVFWGGASTVAFTPPGVTLTGLTSPPLFAGDTSGIVTTPTPTALSSNGSYNLVVKSTLLNSGNVTVGFNATGLFPAVTGVDVVVTEFSVSVVS